MHRAGLLAELAGYQQQHAVPCPQAERVIDFVQTEPNCFERSNQAGHITGSAWLLDPDRNRVLLTLHRKFGQWLQLGGHADGDTQPLRVAIKEAQEESGIQGIQPIITRIFDIDCHWVDSGPEPAHVHYDIRYLLVADSDQYQISDESIALGWFTMEDQALFKDNPSVLRLFKKWQQFDWK